MPSKISADFLKDIIMKQGTYALIDVRERPEFARGQIMGATNLPRRELEFRIFQNVPNKDVQTILYDDDGRRSLLSARTLEKLGYNNVFYLEGGIGAWLESGNSLVKGLNRPCKLFGEQVAVNEKVPQITPQELKNCLDHDENIVVIDVRPPEEINKSGSIPGSVNIQGFDLASRIFDYADKYDKIIVTCAGRTRGIIAAQTLIQMGIQQVYDLKDGTMGWLLAGFELEKGIPGGARPSQKAMGAAESFAMRLLEENDIKLISVEELQGLQQETQKNLLYLFDVRTPDEYVTGHIPGSISLPGGQAVQRADDFVSVRQGDIVFASNNFARAVITAFWYKQMGFPYVYAVNGGIGAWADFGLKLETGSEESIPCNFKEVSDKVKKIKPDALKRKMEDGSKLLMINVDDSRHFSEGHIPGSCWVPRGRLELEIGNLALNTETIIIVCHDGINSVLGAEMLMEIGYLYVYALDGGMSSWETAGFEFETGLTGVDGEPDDVYLKAYDRGREAMEEYLRWEKQLVYKPI